MEALENSITLKDGAIVTLHPIDSCDRECILDSFGNLSSRSRQARYHMPIRKLPNSYLQSLLHADNQNSVVVVAHHKDSDRQHGAGLARYVRLDSEPGIAEFSITITDDYQDRGLGAQMLKYLVKHAHSNQISTLRGHVLSSNKPMIKLLERYNCSIRREDDNTLCYEIDITSRASTQS